MIFLDQFKLPTHAEEDDICKRGYGLSFDGYTDTRYPCDIFIKKEFRSVDFSDVTIIYGGNGSGKSTLLNLITKKLNLKRVAPFNTSSIFDIFVDCCQYRMGCDEDGDLLHIPNGSRIITSDDVFDYMLNARINNADVNNGVKKYAKQHLDLKYSPTIRMTGLKDYENFREQVLARKKSTRQYVYQYNGKEVSLGSNGETALDFFYKKLQDDRLFLLDEPENSLSPKFQIQLADMIKDMAKYCGCQFIIATHSPFMLAIDGAKIYDLDAYPVTIKNWWELENPRTYFEFFDKHSNLFKK